MTDWKELNSMNPQNIWKLNVIFGSIKKCCWKICSLPLRWSFLWERAMCVLPDKWSATAPFSWWWRPCGWWAGGWWGEEILRWWDDDEEYQDDEMMMRFIKMGIMRIAENKTRMRMVRWGWGWVYKWNDGYDNGCYRVFVRSIILKKLIIKLVHLLTLKSQKRILNKK